MPKLDVEYEGWTNWETYNIHTWIMNYESFYDRMVSERRKAKFTAESAKKLIQRVFPNGTPDMRSQKHLRKINYEELAEAFNE